MKILYIHETMGSLGGAESNVLLTARMLAGRGHDIGLVYFHATGNGDETWRQVFNGQLHNACDYPDVEDTVRYIQDFSPEVVYVHKCQDAELLQWLVESGLYLVRMVHDHDIYCMRGYRYNPITRHPCEKKAGNCCVFPCLANIVRDSRPDSPFPVKIQSFANHQRVLQLSRQFDLNFVVTEFMKSQLVLNGFKPEKIRIMPPVPKDSEVEQGVISDRENLILYIGQIIRGKGVDLFIKSLAQVRKPFRAIVAGDGRERIRCEKLARKLGLEDRVEFVGFVTQEVIRSYCHRATTVVVPSVWPEPIATVGLEVLRYGLPVVAFDSGGISDWLRHGKNGFLVKRFDIRGLARSIDILLADKERARKMGEFGRAFVNQHYNFRNYIDKLEGFLGEDAQDFFPVNTNVLQA